MLPDKRDHALSHMPMQGYIVTRPNGEAIGPLTPEQLDAYYMGRLRWEDAPKLGGNK